MLIQFIILIIITCIVLAAISVFISYKFFYTLKYRTQL
ncbi:hypothetical protein TPE_1155 [Treponema pedis str. T A4]|uniref:Uncharacterized protein n=1 Tax=Treponema pedis str. T A4 TaxID=1291379 RepID=S5ZU14_9SPIR|nr:hypothetical protein TPE_1155 [Treponema pedis str. T A4]